jgi:hypothetical protein
LNINVESRDANGFQPDRCQKEPFRELKNEADIVNYSLINMYRTESILKSTKCIMKQRKRKVKLKIIII